MARDIKFRAWDILNKEMIRQVAILGLSENFVTNFDTDYIHNSQYWSENEGHSYTFHLMQFTGMFDVDGKEVYEGDILEHKNADNYLVAVFERGEFRLQSQEESLKRNEITASIHHTEFCKVIGNIYENQELIALSE